MASTGRAPHRGRFSDKDKRSRALALRSNARAATLSLVSRSDCAVTDRVSPVVRFFRTQITLGWIPGLSQKRSDPNIMANGFNHRLLVRRETISQSSNEPLMQTPVQTILWPQNHRFARLTGVGAWRSLAPDRWGWRPPRSCLVRFLLRLWSGQCWCTFVPLSNGPGVVG